MADVIDYAQERVDEEMKARLRALPTFNIASLMECEECGEEIPSKRRALGAVKRCIDCQNHYEVKSR